MSGAPEPAGDHAALITLERVSLAPNRLHQISLELQRGTTAVLGLSGAGKTSLLNVLAGFEKPQGGKIECNAETFWTPSDGGLWMGMTVSEHLAAMTRDHKAASAILEVFDLSPHANRPPELLSRGQQSRLSVARALLSPAPVLIMDEPLAHIDPSRRGAFWKVIRESISAAGQSLIFATHEPELVLAEARRAVCIADGRVEYCGEVDSLYWNAESRELATFLGDVNWLPDAERILWFDGGPVAIPQCLRPEQLEIQPAGNSSIEIEASIFRGTHEEVRLRHLPTGTVRTFWHRPASPRLSAGGTAALRLRQC